MLMLLQLLPPLLPLLPLLLLLLLQQLLPSPSSSLFSPSSLLICLYLFPSSQL
jgi:hypothetical protein